MKFIVSSYSLASRLQAIGRVINSKNTLPILNCFLIELKDCILIATASDSETTLTFKLPVTECDTNGVFAIDAQLLINSLRELPDQPLTVEVNNDTYEVLITYLNGQFNMVGVKPDEYPVTVEPEPSAVQVELGGAFLNDGLGRSLFATANDELRPAMNGVFFDFQPDSFTLVASDAHKLVRSRTTTISMPEPANLILPKKPATMVKNIFPRDTESVRLTFDSHTAVFETDDYRLVCRLTEGRYPNYNAVIPQNAPYQLTVDRMTLLSALKRVAVATSEATSLVKFQIAANSVNVSTQDYDFSKSADETVACQYNGEEMCIGFKVTFLIDILANLPSGEVVFHLFDPSRTTLILPSEQEENNDVLMMIMPMMINY